MRMDFSYEADGIFIKKTMADKSNQYCINVHDESIMEWYNVFASSFMCVGRKPHPFGNERHKK